MLQSGENYHAYPHQRIWDETQNGAGTGSYQAVSRGWADLIAQLGAVLSYVDATVGGIEATRTGVAAEAAGTAMTPLGAWVEQAQQLALAMSDRVDEQAQAFSATQRSIPPVVHVPKERGFGGLPGIDSLTTSDHEAAEKAAANAEQIARERMSSFQSDSNMRLAATPTFTPLPSSEGSIGVPGVQGVGGVGGGASGGSATPSGDGHPITTAPAAAAPAPPAAPPTVSPAPVTTSGQSYTPSGAEPYQRQVPVAPAAVVDPAAAPGFGAGRGGGGGGGRAGRFGGGGAGSVPRNAPFVPSTGPGAGSGTTAAAGAAGRGGPAPMGAAAGGGRGRGEDDLEHERPSWLLEDDPDAIVGKLDPVAPPVIGRPDWQQ